MTRYQWQVPVTSLMPYLGLCNSSADLNMAYLGLRYVTANDMAQAL